MFGFFKKKKKPGCLAGKTENEKVAFFACLSTFAASDPGFFEQQYLDLKPDERKEFDDWVIKDRHEKKQILFMLDSIHRLLREKRNNPSTQ